MIGWHSGDDLCLAVTLKASEVGQTGVTTSGVALILQDCAGNKSTLGDTDWTLTEVDATNGPGHYVAKIPSTSFVVDDGMMGVFFSPKGTASFDPFSFTVYFFPMTWDDYRPDWQEIRERLDELMDLFLGS